MHIFQINRCSMSINQKEGIIVLSFCILCQTQLIIADQNSGMCHTP